MAVADHFPMSPCIAGEPHPIDIGHLALDGYDPTYPGPAVSLGPYVYECTTCWALTIHPHDHATTHEDRP